MGRPISTFKNRCLARFTKCFLKKLKKFRMILLSRNTGCQPVNASRIWSKYMIFNLKRISLSRILKSYFQRKMAEEPCLWRLKAIGRVLRIAFLAWPWIRWLILSRGLFKRLRWFLGKIGRISSYHSHATN